ncbi:MAG: response regulator [Nitriliruptorales bacterium]|nr:response regulator [Nitriliruptorales bacterium]
MTAVAPDAMSVLVVEDTAAQRTLIAHLLRPDGDGRRFELTAAGDLAAALDQIRASHFDAALVDLGLPDSDGPATVASLREQHPDLPVVVFTSAALSEVADELFTLGVQDVLSKDTTDRETLRSSLEHAVRRHHGHQRSVLSFTDVDSPADLQRAIEMSADGMLVVDEDGMVVFANAAAERLFEGRDQQLVGSTFGFPLHGTIELVLPGGRPCHVELLTTWTQWEDEDATVVALRDVTERVRAEQMLRDALMLRDEVVSIVAHDLRSPLAVIVGMLETLERQVELTGNTSELMARMKSQAWRMNRLIENLLTITKLEASSIEPERGSVDLRDLVDEVLGGLEIEAPEIRLPADLRAFADKGHVDEIISNFLSNAAKYGAPPIQIHGEEREGAVEIRVIDHGEGVPEQFASRLFERFSRASHDTRGTGIGLAITQRLAGINGGEVWYEPVEPHGSSFGLRLPRWSPEDDTEHDSAGDTSGTQSAQ